MSLLGNIVAALRAKTARGGSGPSAENAARLAEWEAALDSGGLPSFVAARLANAAAGRTPWLATTSAAELGLLRRRGIRPLAVVSGTCWLHYGFSWTRGHAEGWRRALARLQQEAHALGANAVVDVRLRKVQLELHDSMDFTLIGTAVRVAGLPAGEHAVVATVPALEFLRLVEAGIVPVGLAIGAQYQHLDPGVGRLAQRFRAATGLARGVNITATSAGRVEGSRQPFTNAMLPELSTFWEGVRRAALAELQLDAARQGSGVLAHTQLAQLFRIERNNSPPRFLGRHIAVGTVVSTRRASPVPHQIRPIIDLRGASASVAAADHNAYPVRDEETAI